VLLGDGKAVAAACSAPLRAQRFGELKGESSGEGVERVVARLIAVGALVERTVRLAKTPALPHGGVSSWLALDAGAARPFEEGARVEIEVFDAAAPRRRRAPGGLPPAGPRGGGAAAAAVAAAPPAVAWAMAARLDEALRSAAGAAEFPLGRVGRAAAVEAATCGGDVSAAFAAAAAAAGLPMLQALAAAVAAGAAQAAEHAARGGGAGTFALDIGRALPTFPTAAARAPESGHGLYALDESAAFEEERALEAELSAETAATRASPEAGAPSAGEEAARVAAHALGASAGPPSYGLAGARAREEGGAADEGARPAKAPRVGAAAVYSTGAGFGFGLSRRI
jgi:hypothetical protein